jgi:iron complex transport system permease protein
MIEIYMNEESIKQMGRADIGRSKRITTILIPVLIAFLIISIFYTVSIGSTRLSIGEVYKIIIDRIFHNGNGIDNLYSMPHYQIVWNIRLPRVLFGVVCGMGLSLCGVVMQAIVLNPIADPYILGISSGASAGAAFALLLPIPLIFGTYQVTFASFIGACTASGAVYFMAKIGGNNKVQPMTLLLSGIAVNAVMSAATSLLIFLAKSQESIAAIYNWQMGTLASAQWSTLGIPLIATVGGGFFFFLNRKKLNIIMMGEEDARALGMNTSRYRGILFAICSLIVASLVSVTGIIGFVGLIIPHTIRFLIRSSNHSYVILLSAFLGGTYLIWADAFARGAFGVVELPLGIVTSFIGAPFFLYLMIRNAKRVNKV